MAGPFCFYWQAAEYFRCREAIANYCQKDICGMFMLASCY
jgi:hypothetical protein